MLIRMEIYKEALSQNEAIKAFFLEDSPDEILTNIKVYNYIDKIKNSIFERGIIEIGLFINIYNINILFSLVKSFNNF